MKQKQMEQKTGLIAAGIFAALMLFEVVGP